MRLVEKAGLRDHDITPPDTYFSFEPSIKTDQATFVLKDPGKPLPKLERFGGKDISDVRITQDGTVTEVTSTLLPRAESGTEMPLSMQTGGTPTPTSWP
jgi:hypothetical protein